MRSAVAKRRLIAALAAAATPFALSASEPLPEEPADVEGARLALVPEISLVAPAGGPAFRRPGAVAVDLFGNVFVADTGNHRVVQYDARGAPVFEYGGHGWRDGELSGPTDVTAGEGFRLFVADAGNERVQQFDIGDTSPEGTVFPFREGAGFGGEELVRPWRLDVDAEGRVYVSDDLCHCVWIFGPTGELAAKLGGLGDQATRFRDPGGVAVGPKGRVHVADAGNARVQIYDAIGNWVATWEGFVEPLGLDVAPDGTVWVADAGSALVTALTPDGHTLLVFGGAGDGPGRFRAPVDVAVGPDGRIWVVDEERETVEAFRVRRGPDDRAR